MVETSDGSDSEAVGPVCIDRVGVPPAVVVFGYQI